MKRRLKEIGSKYECDLMQVGNDIFAPAFDDNAKLPSFIIFSLTHRYE